LVGLNWGERVAEAARAMPGVVIGACHARNVNARIAFAARFGCRAFASYTEMILDSELEGIVVMSPNALHAEHSIAALQAGKHVLVTKPIASSLSEASTMIATAQASSRVLAVGHQSRRQPAVRKMKQLLAADALGRAVMIEGNTSSPTGMALATDSWRTSAVECPGGPLLQLGIHYVDNFQYLLGPVRRVLGWQSPPRSSGAAPDTTLTLLEFSGGSSGTLASSYVVPSMRWIRLMGTEGAATFDGATGLTVQVRGRDVASVIGPVPSADIIRDTLAEELQEFVSCIHSQSVPAISRAR
jgi:predicted dehydrogenase